VAEVASQALLSAWDAKLDGAIADLVATVSQSPASCGSGLSLRIGENAPRCPQSHLLVGIHTHRHLPPCGPYASTLLPVPLRRPHQHPPPHTNVHTTEGLQGQGGLVGARAPIQGVGRALADAGRPRQEERPQGRLVRGGASAVWFFLLYLCMQHAC
jgi:hypothetical protein